MLFRLTVVAFVCLAFSSALWAEADAPKRRAVPTAEAQAKATALLKNIFKTEYADHSPSSKRAFALKLEEEATQTNDDPTARYVMMRESRDLLVQEGEVYDALRLAGRMEKEYSIPGVEAELAAIAPPRLNSDRPNRSPQIANCALGVAEVALRRLDWDGAAKAIQQARAEASDRISPLALRVESLAKRVRLAQEAADAVKAGMQQLQAHPEDPAANLTVGRALCFDQDQWDAGLPLLARAGDPELRQIVRLEMRKPAGGEEALHLADEWWSLPAKSGVPKSQSQQRAAHWYGISLHGLSGLHRMLAQERINQSKNSGGNPTLDLLALVNLQTGAAGGVWQFTQDGLISGPEQWTRMQFSYTPPEKYDFKISFIRKAGNSCVDELCRFGSSSFLWETAFNHNAGFMFGILQGPGAPDGVLVKPTPNALVNGRKYEALVKVRKTRVQAYLDGKLIQEFEPAGYQMSLWSTWSLPNPECLGVGTWESPTVFQSAEVVEVSGKGEIKFP